VSLPTRWRGRLARLLPHLLAAAPLLLVAGEALARAGGGHSYSGGSSHSSSGGGFSSHSSGGGDGSGAIVLLIQLLFSHPFIGIPLLVIVALVYYGANHASRTGPGFSTGAEDALGQAASAQAAARAGLGSYQLEALRKDDPDFSEPLFLDFVAALVSRGVAAAGAGDLAPVERYLAGPQALAPFGAGGWRNVVVGTTRLRTVGVGPEGSRVVVDVALGATGTAGGRWWGSAWTLVRKAGVRSKGPGEITRLACPACGAGAERKEDGSCRYCGQRPAPGEAAWALLQVALLEEESRPPISLGGYAEERGTELPTVRSPLLQAELLALKQRLPELDWEKASARCGQVFLALQKGWSERDLAAIRTLTTDAVFATWRYWIEAYRAAGLRNVLEQVQVARVEPARATLDRYYAAITVRIFASMVDRTVDDGGRVVDGQAAPRTFTEYWTFVRTLDAAKGAGTTCPGCGATLPAGQSGQCPYCASLVGAPAFDWILSRIDQDEDYTGG
jgi:predicted lipid-binding transport protein (Tim44 family)